MICVPYIINENYKVAQLSATQDAKPCYIIEKEPGNSEVRLLRFEPKQTAFDPSQGYGDRHCNDYVFQVDPAACSVTIHKEKHTADVVVALRMQSISFDNKKKQIVPMAANFTTPDGLRARNNTIYYDFREITDQADDIIIVNVKLFEAAKQIAYDFSVNVAPHDNIYDIVIDFGSEASQIWMYQRGNDATNIGNLMPLFHNIKDSSPLSGESDGAIYQFDPSKPELYRSLFFLKRDIKGADIQQDDITFINLEGDIAKILEDNVALPNMKLMYHNNVPLPTFRINGHRLNIYHRVSKIRAEILKFFFDTALRLIDDTNNRPVACKITFLVPNTYTQQMLSKVHTNLIKDLQQLRCDHPFLQIKGDIEVSTFSESDASFFGWYNAGDFQRADDQKSFLIVDVGKGTTDFSVLRVTSHNGLVNIERMARSGFVGAGNVMTFALLASIIRHIAYEISDTQIANIYNAVSRMACHTDRALKNKLYRGIEDIKCAPHIDGRPTISQFLNAYDFSALRSLDALEINKLIDILNEAKMQQCFQDDNDIVVANYAKLMAEMLFSELAYVYDDDMHLSRVLLSGRGAKSKPLADAIKAKLHGIDSTMEIVLLNDADIKSGCLKGPLNRSLHLDHMNMSIVGWPQQKRNRGIRITPRKEEPKSKDADNKPDKPAQAGRFSRFFRELGDLFGNGEQTVGVATTGAGKDGNIVSTGFTQEQLARAFNGTVSQTVQTAKWQEAQGTEYTLAEDTNLFVIGNRRCTANLTDGATLGKKRMYFDGTDFLLRDINTSTRFIPDPANDEEGFLAETFFPMTEIGGNANLQMPKLLQVLRLCDGLADSDDDDFADTGADNAAPASSSTLTTTTVDDDDDFADE